MEARVKEVEYVLYDKEDNYIIGFPSIVEMSEYLGNSKPTLSKVLYRNMDKRGQINKTLTENNTYDCSQKLFTYTNRIENVYGNDLGKGCSIYKFWEEY